MKNDEHPIAGDPRVTAYALGELEGDEAREVEELLANDPRGSSEVAELRELGEALRRELVQAGTEGAGETLTSAQREAIAAQIHTAPVRRSPLRRVAPLVGGLAAVALGVLGWQLTMQDRMPAIGIARESEAPATAPFTYTIFGGADGATASRPVASRRSLSQEEVRQLARMGYTGRETSDLEALGYGEVELSLESYDRIDENPFVLVAQDPLSTFSIDVDTASYANVRRYLNDGALPPPDAVRIEEMINYFVYDYPEPEGNDPFSVDVETTTAPWAPSHRLVRIGLQGRAITSRDPKPRNLVFLLDVSGSMNNERKLPLVQRGMRLLVDTLGPDDSVAIVVYAGSSGLVLPATRGDRREEIVSAIERLKAGGSTNGGEGIQLAYDVARRNYVDGGINRVILCTDGDFNVGVTDQGSLTRLIEDKAKTGVFLSVLGFGTGNLKDSTMEKLADRGNGNYAYIDSLHEARKVLVQEGGATLETIAKDVKLQVEFNPNEVQAFRLIGYENRVLEHQDFADDTKDAGEIGAGHRVTALYEVVPVGVRLDVPTVDPLKYQTPGRPSGDAYGGEMLTVNLRWKQPESDTSTPRAYPVTDGGAGWIEASDDLKFAAAVAGFGMVLRGSQHAGGLTLGEVHELALEGAGPDPFGYRNEFVRLVERAQVLQGR